MIQLDLENTKAEYSHETIVNRYISCVENIGLWQSEKIVFSKYLNPQMKIFDIGCGTGRTTFGLHDTGYRDIVGLDLSEEMIFAAQKIANDKSDEIYRVLKPGGTFIFTTHDINNPQFVEYWNNERIKWEKDEQNKRLLEYGDLIFSKPDDYGDAVSFVHVPLNGEVETHLKTSGFQLIYSELRSNICEENPAVLEFSVDCKFWVAKKS